MSGPGAEEGAAARVRQEAADWFARLRAGASEAELAAFAAWRADTLNGDTYDRLARQWDQARFLANSNIGRGRDLSRARAWHRTPAARIAAVAALLVLILGTSLLLRPALRPDAATAPVAYASKAEAIRTVMLADGSRVTLDRNSAVRVAYDASARVIELLKGRARFDVAHDAARPFRVRADGGTVIAHGTVFDVELRPALVRVVLLRGSVEVRADSALVNGGGQGHMLRPGQALIYAHGKVPSPPVAADPDDSLWSEAMLSFNATPLREAVARFNRRNDTRLVLGSDRIGDLRITGAFTADDPAGFAEAAAAMFQLDLRRQPDASLSLH
ncbi:FecR family protein [Sphingomonas koreensis]|uniref:FecR family protein n=1 Tax=Sphingomonas koreensis TaxID=93064 RepID=UPI00234F0489|nr:FecR domain-containing protein [Sphingomonas koreensis]MDC7810153.1 FecR domain-containing protein [Sphingomonas koreensis]